MSINGMGKSWEVVVSEAHEFYAQTSEYLRTGRPLDRGPFLELTPRLDQMLNASEELRRQADAVLRPYDEAYEARRREEGYETRQHDAEYELGRRDAWYEPNQREEEYGRQRKEEYGQVSKLLLAAATIDAMLARDIAALDPDIEYARHEELAAEESNPESLYFEGKRDLEQADALFRGLSAQLAGGAALPDRQALIGEVQQVTADLFNRANAPAHDFMLGLLDVAGGGALDFLSAGQHVDVLDTLEKTGQKLAKHAPRFLRAHVSKIVTLRPDGSIVTRMAERIAGRTAVRDLLVFVAAPERLDMLAGERITNAPNITEEAAAGLRHDLMVLEHDYQEQMDWIGKSARWLRRSVKPLKHLVFLIFGPLSHVVICGVFFVGLGYVGYSLTDRFDARDLGFADRVEGVSRLVVRHIPAAP
jgi:hypothetical protein